MKAIKLNKNQNLTKKGFTIIEVVLVLAIAGLIFLMVFFGFTSTSTITKRRAAKARCRNGCDGPAQLES